MLLSLKNDISNAPHCVLEIIFCMPNNVHKVRERLGINCAENYMRNAGFLLKYRRRAAYI